MSVKAALQFIQTVRQNKQLQAQIQQRENPLTGEELVELGREAGFEYTEAELQTAFKHDWVMRSLHYGLMDTSLEK
ncbi:MAG: Nif11-like leader peptide family natural product precursor [Oscillatoria sp. PMC 1068.18]|nr:Nif11-like leader peptide family natural product precursor [Oscillatoria sp. PMC 1076.18]MEC4990300.1 Nif11-like leader peptide family natural product precursor [Oscillatoria sp. PMC 1068.18]